MQSVEGREHTARGEDFEQANGGQKVRELKNFNHTCSQEEGLLSGPRCGTRHTMILWAFLGCLTLFIQRVDLNIALVAMATQNASQPLLNSSYEGCEGQNPEMLVPHRPVKLEEFQWSSTLQGIILASFYYGYFVSQIPGSFLANSMGGKQLFALSVASCSALSLVTPLTARLHPALLIANRVLQGALQGVVFPAIQVLLSRWAHSSERSRMVAFSYAGGQAGTVVGMLGAGYISDSAIGWPWVFYISGVLGLLWCGAWLTLVFDSPSEHPHISRNEKHYLLKDKDHSHRKSPPVPWKRILTLPALYAIACAHFANDWGCFAIMTCLPKYMKQVLNYDLSKNGFLSSLPYLVMWAANMIAGLLADYLRKPNRLKTVHVRKLMIFIGLLGPACLLLTAAYLPGCDGATMVALLTLAMGLSGFTIAGHSVNHLDIAPVFAGLMFAMTNSVGTTSGWVGPALAGALTEHHVLGLRHGWQMFFLISAGVFAVGGTVYILLARGEVQPWARVQSDEESLYPATISYSVAEEEESMKWPSYEATGHPGVDSAEQELHSDAMAVN